MNNKTKLLICIISIILIVGISFTIWKITDTKWERTFEITYDGYVSKNEENTISLSNPYTKYTIKNKTNKTVSSIYAVIKVKTWEGKSFKFEKIIALDLKAGESLQFKIFDSDIKEELNNRNISTYMWEMDIIKIKFK